MIAILGGIGAAACFASSTLCSSRSSRMIEPGSVLAWVMLVGLLVTLPAVAVAGPPSEVRGTDLGWLAVIGITNSVGLLLAYRALRVAKVGLVAPVVSTEGAIAAVLAIAGGEGIAPGTGALLAVIGTGVCLAALAPGEAEAPAGRPGRGMGYAVAAACSFGLALYATARAGAHVPVAWLLVPARAAGALLFAAPLALMGRLRLTRPAVPLVVAAGLSEVLGVASYALGARHGIAVASVLASQFATISVVAGYLLFRERLAGVQVLGVAATVLGVAALSAIQA